MPIFTEKLDFGAMFDCRDFQKGTFGARLLLEKGFGGGVAVFRSVATL